MTQPPRDPQQNGPGFGQQHEHGPGYDNLSYGPSPTEQFPPASGDDPFAEHTPALRRRPVIIGLAALAALVVAGGIVWIVLASSGSADAAPPPASPSAAPPPPVSSSAPPSGKHQGQHAPGVRGTVTAENGNTWTVKTAKGETVTVTIGDDTKFGTEKAPTDRAKIPVGSHVAIAGANKDGKIDAKRIKVAEG